MEAIERVREFVGITFSPAFGFRLISGEPGLLGDFEIVVEFRTALEPPERQAVVVSSRGVILATMRLPTP